MKKRPYKWCAGEVWGGVGEALLHVIHKPVSTDKSTEIVCIMGHRERVDLLHVCNVE